MGVVAFFALREVTHFHLVRVVTLPSSQALPHRSGSPREVAMSIFSTQDYLLLCNVTGFYSQCPFFLLINVVTL